MSFQPFLFLLVSSFSQQGIEALSATTESKNRQKCALVQSRKFADAQRGHAAACEWLRILSKQSFIAMRSEHCRNKNAEYGPGGILQIFGHVTQEIIDSVNHFPTSKSFLSAPDF